MGLKRLSFSPLFFIFGFYYALIGKFTIFIIYTLTDFLHEIGHSIVAERQGYYLNKITLMPFGAVISGETDGMNVKDELKIAFAGPLTNVFLGLFFLSLWWIYPPIYAYTDVIVEANFSLALINLLPFFPLDGGRILLALLSRKTERGKSLKICKRIGVFGGIILVALFILTLFYTPNFSVLFFASFIIAGAVSRDKENKYLKLYTQFSEKKLKKGICYKKIGIDKTATVKKLISVLDAYCLNEVVIYGEGKEIATLSPKQVEKIIESANLYKPLSDYLNL